jgi:alcohol dehydrogenase class IV
MLCLRGAQLPADSVVRFEFATATRIIFGPAVLKELAPLACTLGSHALVVTGQNAGRAAALRDGFEREGLEATLFTVAGEPTLEVVAEGTARSRGARCDLVIGFGGGSALDAAKAIAALLTNDGDILDYVEVIGRGRSLSRPAAPCIVVPTTAGTGTEVTRNAVLTSPEHHVKVSLRSPLLLPRIALVDPELTHSLPPSLTASTGLDALTQLIEAYVSARANPLTDAFCVEGIRRAVRSLRRAVDHPDDGAAREDMALASLLSGLVLANAGLGAVHGFAAPIGGMFRAPHGAVCAALLPHVVSANLRALRARAPASGALMRYSELARLLTGTPTATAEDGREWLHALVVDLRIARLAEYGLGPADVDALVEAAARASSMKTNPVVLTSDELTDVLMRAV